MINSIVTGTGRCGTTYLAKLLTSMSYPCGHESIFNYEDENAIKNRLLKSDYTLSICSQSTLNIRYDPNKKDWIKLDEIIADSSYMAAPYLNWKELEKIKIIHVYRNPLDVIRSFLNDIKYFSQKTPNNSNIFNELGYENKIYNILPELSEIDNSLERACYYYIEWNKMIKNNCTNKEVLTIKIEDKEKDKKIIDFLGISCVENKFFNNTKENTFFTRKSKIKIQDIPNGKIKNDFIDLLCEKKYAIKY